MDAWDFQPDVALSLLPFHALTGSDSTSFLAGHSKKSTFKFFLENVQLLSTLGKDLFTTDTLQNCKKKSFVRYIMLIKLTPLIKHE